MLWNRHSEHKHVDTTGTQLPPWGKNRFKPPYELLLLFPVLHFNASAFFLSGQVAKPHAQTLGEGQQPPARVLQQGRAPLPRVWAGRALKGRKQEQSSRSRVKTLFQILAPSLCTEAVIPDKELLTHRPAPGCSGPWLGHSLCTSNTAMSCTGHTTPSLHERVLMHQASVSAGISKRRMMMWF